jgi:hypothetical protein
MTTCAGYQDWWQIHPQKENDAFLWQEHALTASAASSEIFAIKHAQNEPTTEPVGAHCLEKVM